MLGYELTGLRPVNLGYDIAVLRCMKGLLENPELVVLHDIESGYPYLATKEHQQALIDLWQSTIPKGNLEPKGLIICFGTGGDVDKKFSWEDFESIYYNPNNYKSIDIDWNTNKNKDK